MSPEPTASRADLSELDDLSDDVGRFLREIIPQSPDAPAIKARKEAIEFAQEPSLGEAADVLICLLGWAELNGMHGQDIVETAKAKMRINLGRTWRKEPDGTWQHV